jgi:hypothetical protein
MEHESYTIDNGAGVTRWISVVQVDENSWHGCGPTEDAALLDAMEKASRENDEARLELGILLGQRGKNRGGRPCGS